MNPYVHWFIVFVPSLHCKLLEDKTLRSPCHPGKGVTVDCFKIFVD